MKGTGDVLGASELITVVMCCTINTYQHACLIPTCMSRCLGTSSSTFLMPIRYATPGIGEYIDDTEDYINIELDYK